MKLNIWLGAALIVAGAAMLYFFLFRRANPPLPAGTVRVGSATFSVELATSSIAQARGLSFRDSLGANDGMLFIFSQRGVKTFWMKDMNFPLDIIWIGNASGTTGATEKVLGFAENAAPQPGAPLWQLKIYSSPAGTDKVLEVNAGTVAKDDIHIGDAVQIGGAGGI